MKKGGGETRPIKAATAKLVGEHPLAASTLPIPCPSSPRSILFDAEDGGHEDRRRRAQRDPVLEQLWTPQQLPDGSYRGFNNIINGYGLGWPVIRRAEHPAITPTGGDRATIFIYPEDYLTVIVLTNLMGAGPQKFVDQIAAQYIPDLAVEN